MTAGRLCQGGSPAPTGVATYLRQALVEMVPPDALRKPTLTAEERAAYRLAFEAIEQARQDRVELRLSEALAHGGANPGLVSSVLDHRLEPCHRPGPANREESPYSTNVRIARRLLTWGS